MRDPLLDLFIGSRCAACHRPGRVLCADCASGLPRNGRPARPDPSPEGLLAPYAAGCYEDPLRPLLVGLKERRQVALAAPLGRVLGAVVMCLVSAEAQRRLPMGRVVLVPVPSSRKARRARGIDHTLRLARVAAGECRRSGFGVVVVPMLRHRGGARDQAGLSREERERNASGRFAVSRSGRRAASAVRGSVLVVVDDILTTGHTMREAQQLLAATGFPVLGGAVVAATERRAHSRMNGWKN